MGTFKSIEQKVATLPNGTIVDTEQLIKDIKKTCHYVQYVTIGAKDDTDVFAVIFPSRKLFSAPDYEKSPEEGCFCPRHLNELGKCLSGCMQTINNSLQTGYAKINSAVIINSELSMHDGLLTPELEIIPDNAFKKFNTHLNNLFGDNKYVDEEVFNMKLV